MTLSLDGNNRARCVGCNKQSNGTDPLIRCMRCLQFSCQRCQLTHTTRACKPATDRLREKVHRMVYGG